MQQTTLKFHFFQSERLDIHVVPGIEHDAKQPRGAAHRTISQLKPPLSCSLRRSLDIEIEIFAASESETSSINFEKEKKRFIRKFTKSFFAL